MRCEHQRSTKAGANGESIAAAYFAAYFAAQRGIALIAAQCVRVNRSSSRERGASKGQNAECAIVRFARRHCSPACCTPGMAHCALASLRKCLLPGYYSIHYSAFITGQCGNIA